MKKIKVGFCCDQIITCGGLIVPFQYVSELNKLGYEAFMIANGHNNNLESFYGVEAKPMSFLNEWTEDDIVISVWWMQVPELEQFKGRKIQFVQGKDIEGYVGDDLKAKCLQTRQSVNWEVMAVSNFAGEWTGRPFTVIPNGVPDRFKSENKERDIDILIEGNYEENKGIEEMIKLLEDIPGKHAWLGRSTPIQFKGTKFENPPQKDIPSIYQRAKILLKLSKVEGFSLPLLEGMASGCAIITKNMGGNMEFCKFGENCETKFNLKNVLENDKLRNYLVDNGYKTAEIYSLNNSVKKLIEFLCKQ